MKKSITISLLFAGCALLATSPDMWKEYEDARKADKPRTQVDVLDRIIEASVSSRDSWDFYDAWTRKLATGSSINWKDRDRLTAARDSAFAAYGEPVIELVCGRMDEAAVKESAAVLKSKVSRGFYESGRFWNTYGSEYYGKALGRLVNNDYEFALWYLLGRSRGQDAQHIRSLIVQTAGAQSQQAAYAGFDEVKRCADSLSSIAAKCALYEKYEKRWAGSAASLLAGQALLSLKMDTLCLDKGATSESFRRLRAECGVFEQKRATFTGTGKILAGECTVVEALIGRLDDRQLLLSADSTGVIVSFRNLAGAELKIMGNDFRSKDTLYCEAVVNPVCSYYVLDTVVVPFPVKDDGDYLARAESAGMEASCNIARHSISAAAVCDAGGYKLYATRYDSGEPLDLYDVSLYRNNADEPVLFFEDVRQEGVPVSVPEEMSSLLTTSAASRHYLLCSYTDSLGVYHTSGKLSFSGSVSYKRPDDGQERLKAVLLTDCGAFHRGDAVHCKGIIYRDDYMDRMAVASKNTQAKIMLLDPDDNVIATKQVKTNEYGSVTADFVLPSDIRGGLCTIVLESGTRLCSTTVRVDDFVLPDFDCEFDSIDSLYFAGDSVTVSGRVKSYTGHRVPVKEAFFQVSGIEGKEKVIVAQDGSFSMRVPVPVYEYWSSSVTLVVSTDIGSTLQFTKHIPAGRYLDLRFSFENETPASVSKDGRKCHVLCEDKGIFVPEVFNSEGVPQKIPVSCSVIRDGVRVEGAEALSGEKIELELSGEGEYDVTFKASVRNTSGVIYENEVGCTVIRLSPEAASVQADVENVFIPRPDKGISFDFAASRGPVWAVVSLYGNDGECLHQGALHLDGKRGEVGSLTRFELPFEDSYPDTVVLRAFYFRNGRLYQWSNEYERPVEKESFLLEWSSFEEKGVPGTEYTFTIKGAPQSEVAVSVFDKSTETVHSNPWSVVEPGRNRVRLPYMNYVNGTMGRDDFLFTRAMPLMAVNKSAGKALQDTADDGNAAEETVQEDGVRRDFSTVLCWKPQLKLSRSGEAVVTFRTSDKTGTFVLSAFAHNQAMKNAVSRKEMVVSLPVELSVAEPVMLHEGDRYILRAVLSTSDMDVVGTVSLEAGSVGTFSQEIKLGKYSRASVAFPLDVPAGVSALSMKLKFTDSGEHYSDAIAFSVPVASSVLTLTESHSLWLNDDSDRDAALASLRAAFVNTGSDGALLREITVAGMLADALAPHKSVSETSVLGLSDAIATNLLFNYLTGGNEDVSAMKEKLSDFVCPDGGFAWISGMSSSPTVTATVLERNARVRARTGNAFLDEKILKDAVQYLDNRILRIIPDRSGIFNWMPEIGLERYLFVRSFYPEFAFVQNDKEAAKAVKVLGEAADKYLFPEDVRMLPGHIFAKVLRLATLENIYSLEDGASLLEGWNVRSHSTMEVLKSMTEDIESLVEYSVPHRDGGVYFPNLVMPYRGLLSSEAYCHSLLCDLLAPYDADTADGIRLWMLLQKETQAWENDFSFTNAVASIMGGTDRLKNTSVMVLSKEYERPYSELKAAGNGFRISRHFVLTASDGKESVLGNGDTVNAGDRITAVYRIWNAENRSFVRLRLPSFGCLRPVKQLSGNIGWGFGPLKYASGSLVPQGYREVRFDRIDYYFDTFPEEDVEIKDEFFVTQTGTFTAPVVTVESLYAPHYRANGAFEGGMTAE